MRKTIDMLYHGINLTIDGDYYPAQKGSDYLRNGDPGNPPESAEFIIDRVRIGEVEVIDMFEGLKDTEASLDRPPYCLERIEELALAQIKEGQALTGLLASMDEESSLNDCSHAARVANNYAASMMAERERRGIE